jgi:hypothetical protein
LEFGLQLAIHHSGRTHPSDDARNSVGAVVDPYVFCASSIPPATQRLACQSLIRDYRDQNKLSQSLACVDCTHTIKPGHELIPLCFRGGHNILATVQGAVDVESFDGSGT